MNSTKNGLHGIAMELPFLKNKNKGGSGTAMVEVRLPDEDSSNALISHAAEELMTAIHKKDIKSIREALEAICLMINDKE